MDIIRKDVFDLWQALLEFNDKRTNAKFSYFIAKNKNYIAKEIESIQEAARADDEYLEFERKRIEVVKKFGEVGENGLFKEENGLVLIPNDNLKEYNISLKQLLSEYEVAINKQEIKTKQVEELLKEGVLAPKIHKIDIENCPDDIPQRCMDLFLKFDMI